MKRWELTDRKLMENQKFKEMMIIMFSMFMMAPEYNE